MSAPNTPGLNAEQLGDIAGATGAHGSPPPPATIGRYRFDPDELDGVIKDWEKLKSDLEADRARANAFVSVTAPGRDFASEGLATSASNSGMAFIDANDAMIQYADDYIRALKAARRQYRVDDEDSADSINSVT